MARLWTAILGLGFLGVWWAWVFMVGIGTLASLDVVSGTVGFVDALPLGFGFALVGVVPLAALFAASAAETPKGPNPE